MTGLLRPLFLLGVMWASGAWAADPYAEGVAAFRRGDLDEALASLDLAAQQRRSDADLSRIHLLRGQVLAAFQRLEAVQDAFEKALTHDPEAKLDSKRVLPSVVGMLESVRGRLRGQLRVTSTVPAHVYVDAADVGPTPFEGDVRIGRRQVDVRSEDGRVLEGREVLVRPKGVSEVSFTPEPPEIPGPRVVPYLAGRASTFSFRGVGGSGDVGLLIDHFDVSLGVVGGSAFGFSIRLGPSFPSVWKFLGLYAALQGSLFLSETLVGGAGLVGGVTFRLTSWLTVFGEIGGHALTPAPGFVRDSWLLGAGIRLYWPR